MESESIEIAGRKIPIADWEATPESVKLAIEDLHGIVAFPEPENISTRRKNQQELEKLVHPTIKERIWGKAEARKKQARPESPKTGN